MRNFPLKAGAITALDDLLRGRLTDAKQVRTGATLVRIFLPWALVLGAIHGCFIGWYALVGGAPGAWVHMLAVMIKLPALFVLTLFVTFPSLYVFNALVGVGLRFRATLRLLVATIVVNLALAASLGPILAFFTLSTSSYGFIVMLNVVLLGIAGIVSVGFLLKALVGLQAIEREEQEKELRADAVSQAAVETAKASLNASDVSSAPTMARSADDPSSGRRSQIDARSNPFSGWKNEIDLPRRSAMGIFWIWIITYAIVGSQMGWILRPFIGHPNQPLTLFRPRSGSFFESMMHTTGELLDPGRSSDRTPARNSR